jgi:PAS domain S-box-containing protein
MNPPPIKTSSRILIIDDNPLIHSDLRKILCPEPKSNAALNQTKKLIFGESPSVSLQFDFVVDSAFQGREGLELARQAAAAGDPYALAFVDVRMPPGWDGVETISQLWKCCPDLQIVVCTAFSDYSWEAMIRQLGHSPNLVVLKKPFDNIEALQLAHALTEKWRLNRRVKSQLDDLDARVCQRTAEWETANADLKREIVAHKKTEKVLQLSEERFSKAFHAAPLPFAIQSRQPETLIDANEAFLTLLGGDRSRVVGRTPTELGLWSDPRLAELGRQALRGNTAVRSHPGQLRTLAGEERQVLLSIEPLELGSGPHCLLMVQDVTLQIKLESQLRYAQKMEAVGQLAAGVAHDFNNILTIIHGNASLLQNQSQQNPMDAESLNDIITAAGRAARLVRQLLTFSRKQRLDPVMLQLGSVVNDLDEMLKRMLGENITLKVTAAPDLPPVHADLGMLEQVIMNLAANALDAMPKGGTLTIAMELVARSHDELPSHAGPHVCLSVSDTGGGIAPELLPRIFDPFFTTKAVGQGTGLGLATVYGIVQQHHGWVEVQSTVNQGTMFRVFLPACMENPRPKVPPPAPATAAKTGSHCVLVVEDEERIRTLAVTLLRRNGYRVLEAASGQAAWQVFQDHRAEIDLLFTDIMMPGNFSGDELAARLRTANPALPVLFTSGYTPEINQTEFQNGGNFLAKPFTPDQMFAAIRQCLGQPGGPHKK